MASVATETTGDFYTQGEYLRNNPNWHVEDSGWKARQVVEMLQRHGIQPRTLAEVGCGAGEILVELRKQMPSTCRFYGYEISPDAYALCACRAGERLQFFLRDMLSESDTFELALVMDVVEHVEDYFGFLRQLKPRGEYKLIHVPIALSASSVLRNQPLNNARSDVGHIHCFSRDIFHAALEDTGHEVIDWCYTSMVLDGKSKNLGQRLMRWPRRIGYELSPDIIVRLFGGFSALFLTR